MGIFDKLKTVLFEDEEEDIPQFTKTDDYSDVLVKPEEEVNVEARFKNQSLKQEEVEIQPIEKTEPVKEEKSVFQTFDEEEFDRIAAINRNRLLERDRKAREAKEAKEAEQRRIEIQQQQEKERKMALELNKKNASSVPVKEDTEIGNIAKNYGFSPKVDERDRRKFIPSPVISPVYGILDKNYRKEDILPRASSNGTLPKMMDVDKVRKRALGVLENEIENNDPLKDFYSEDNQDKNITEMIVDDTPIEEELTKTAEIKMEDLEEQIDQVINEVNNNVVDNVAVEDDNIVVVNEKQDTEELPNIEMPSRKNAGSAETTDTLESDLFELIDSMYENREDSK